MKEKQQGKETERKKTEKKQEKKTRKEQGEKRKKQGEESEKEKEQFDQQQQNEWKLFPLQKRRFHFILILFLFFSSKEKKT